MLDAGEASMLLLLFQVASDDNATYLSGNAPMPPAIRSLIDKGLVEHRPQLDFAYVLTPKGEVLAKLMASK